MTRPVEVAIRRLDPGLPLPAYARDGDAGLDLLAARSLVLEPGKRALVPTGIAVAIPEGYAGFVQPRSGLALRQGIGLVNSPGLIDSGYRGEIGVVVVNHDSRTAVKIERGDKVAQLVVLPVARARLVECDDLPPSARGDGGFGSSGR
ncbi:MAG: dUTP diphosphatase [Actinomycetota bacterium]